MPSILVVWYRFYLDKNAQYKKTPQNNFDKGKIFKNKDFTESSLLKYYENLEKGFLIIKNERYVNVDLNLVKLKWL